jgi:hypothetical protein
LRFPLNRMIADVLKKFGIYFHQLTPNAIVRLSVYIWALRSQGWSHLPKVSAEYTSYTTKLRPERMGYMKILVVTISHIGKLQKISCDQLPKQVAGRLEIGMVLRQG